MNLSRIIERHAAFQPHKAALHFQGQDISYADLWARIDAASGGLAARLDVRKGDRIAYLGLNHPEMLVLLFALARLGAMLVPLNFRLAPPELEDILDHAGAGIILIDEAFAGFGERLRSSRPGTKRIALHGTQGDALDWSATWSEISAPGTAAPDIAGDDADPMMIVYTSGTTGRPKGAVHTQEGMLWNMINATHCFDMRQDDHILAALPLFHVGGLCIQPLPALHLGCTVTLHPRFDPGQWLDDVESRRITLATLVPAAIKMVMEHPRWAGTDLSTLRVFPAGSSIVPDALINVLHDRGLTVTQVYGSTETGPVTIYLLAADARRRVGFAGKAGLHCEIRLVDGEGRDVAQGAVGEIWVRARNLMQGYWRDPDNPSFRDGWFRSGDLAFADEEGFYRIVSRLKDMIISGGENVYPAEIENVLAEYPEVLECAVVGVDDAKWGEAAVLAVVKKPGSTLDEQAVLKLFDGRLARYKHPKRVVFVDAMPKTALGKVQKPELKKMLG